MALKTWNLASCPFKSMTDGTADLWSLSSQGTATYYYTGGDLPYKPNKVLFNGEAASEGLDLDNLIAGSWGWGDNDSLGEDHLYIRLADDGNPDAEAEEWVQCSEALTLLTAASGKECILLSLLISNISAMDDANIRVYHTTSTGVVRFKWMLDLPADNSPFALDSKIVMGDGDKLKIMADIEDVAVLASGDES